MNGSSRLVGFQRPTHATRRASAVRGLGRDLPEAAPRRHLGLASGYGDRIAGPAPVALRKGSFRPCSAYLDHRVWLPSLAHMKGLLPAVPRRRSIVV